MKIKRKLLLIIPAIVIFSIGIFFINTLGPTRVNAAFAVFPTPAENTEANNYCYPTLHDTEQSINNVANLTACKAGYIAALQTKNGEQKYTENQVCSNSSWEGATPYCKMGWEAVQQGTVGGSGESQNQRQVANICSLDNVNDSCVAGVEGKQANKTEDASCSTASNKSSCQYGWELANYQGDQSANASKSKTFCNGKYSDAADQASCLVGAEGGFNNQIHVCENVNKQAACQAGLALGTNNLNNQLNNVCGSNSSAQPGPNGVSCSSNDSSITCGDSDNWGFNWIICPIFHMVEGVTNMFTAMVNSMLTTNTCPIFGGSSCTGPNPSTSNYYEEAWSSMRNIALVFIIIVGLVMIIAQAIGSKAVDAYTIKSVLPRLLIAAIFISLSWILLEFLVNITNVLGGGIKSLIYAPFSSLSLISHAGSGATTASVILGAGGILAIVTFVFNPILLLLMALSVLLSLLLGFLVLTLRQLLIVALIIFAPIAIASYTLPNTKKLFSTWWDWFFKMLLMYPIIMGFIALGQVFAAVSFQVGSSSSNPMYYLIAIIAEILPLFMLPMTFKLAGGAMSAIGQGVMAMGKKPKAALAKRRNAEFAQDYERHVGRRVLQARASATRALQRGASGENRSKFSKFALRTLAKGVGGYNLEAQMSAKQAQVGKEISDQIATGDDTQVRALTVGDKNLAIAQGRSRIENGRRQFKTLNGGKWVDEADVDAAQSRWGHDQFAQQQALAYEMSKASTESEAQSIAENYNTLADSWHMSGQQRGSAWAGAAYANQNKHLEFKRMKASGPNDTGGMAMDYDAQKGFVDEFYENRGSYNAAQMNSNTIEELKKAHQAAVENNDVDTQNKLAAIAETFMNDAGIRGGGVMHVGEGDDTPPMFDIPQAGDQQGQQGRRIASTPGAGHVAERVVELAKLTGVYTAAPTGFHNTDHLVNTPTPNERPQK